MIKIGLDFAFRTCGVAIIDDKKLIYESFDLSSKKLPVFEIQKIMVDKIWEYINPYLPKEHELVIEDVFTGINPKATINAARSQGAFIDRYICSFSKYPKMVMAASARKNVGISPRMQKAELQLWVIDKLKLAEIPKEIRSQIVSLPIQYERKRVELSKQFKTAGVGRKKVIKKQLSEQKKLYNNTMGKLSTEIKKLTTIDEHIADAVILAMQ